MCVCVCVCVLAASLGGIFSLFLGCSFMSGVELLYFFTVRLWLLVRGAEPAAPRHHVGSSSSDPPPEYRCDNTPRSRESQC